MRKNKKFLGVPFILRHPTHPLKIYPFINFYSITTLFRLNLPRRSIVRFSDGMDVIDEEDRDANEAPKETVIDLGDYYYNDNDDKVEITKVDLPRVQVNGLRQRS